MILLQIPKFTCPDCYEDIEPIIINDEKIEDRLIRFKHPESIKNCKDNGKILSTQRLINFAVSVLHD